MVFSSLGHAADRGFCPLRWTPQKGNATVQVWLLGRDRKVLRVQPPGRGSLPLPAFGAAPGSH